MFDHRKPEQPFDPRKAVKKVRESINEPSEEETSALGKLYLDIQQLGFAHVEIHPAMQRAYKSKGALIESLLAMYGENRYTFYPIEKPVATATEAIIYFLKSLHETGRYQKESIDIYAMTLSGILRTRILPHLGIEFVDLDEPANSIEKIIALIDSWESINC